VRKARINTTKLASRYLCKGKGTTSDPNAYRGIELECAQFKILTHLLAHRRYNPTQASIPEEQFDFARGRSTLQAVKCLQGNTHDGLRHPRGKLHAIFIDYTKAFDLINRSILIDKIEGITGRNPTTRLINVG
jgi:hypothetical protein